MSKHKQPGGIWTAQYAHCAMEVHKVGGEVVQEPGEQKEAEVFNKHNM